MPGSDAADEGKRSLEILEDAFARAPFLNKSECAIIARAAGLSSRQVCTSEQLTTDADNFQVRTWVSRRLRVIRANDSFRTREIAYPRALVQLVNVNPSLSMPRRGRVKQRLNRD